MGKSLRANTKRVNLHDKAATLPAPSGAPTADIFVNLRQEGQPKMWEVWSLSIDKDPTSGAGADTITAPFLMGFEPDILVGPSANPLVGHWRHLGVLNFGAVISVDTDDGWQRKVYDMGSFTDLKVVGTVGGTAPKINIDITPLETS